MRGENSLWVHAAPKLGLLVSNTPQAEDAARELRAAHRFVGVPESDAVVVVGGDGFMLSVLHRVLTAERPKPMATERM